MELIFKHTMILQIAQLVWEKNNAQQIEKSHVGLEPKLVNTIYQS
jgi:hypothetical protein